MGTEFIQSLRRERNPGSFLTLHVASSDLCIHESIWECSRVASGLEWDPRN